MAAPVTRRRFISTAAVLAAAVTAGQVLAAPQAQALANGLLHFAPAGSYAGDIHVYYESGTYYMYYLATDGTYTSKLITTTDFLTWQTVALTTTGSPLPAQNYFVVSILKDGSTYRSYYGNGTTIRGTVSNDLTTWTDAGRSYDIPTTAGTYGCSTRDPYVFWDPDVAKYRMLATAYRTNSAYSCGSGRDVSIALTTSTSSALTSWGGQAELIRFNNTGQDPEVSQAVKIGDRWYLLASLAGESVHYVGRTSYWIGDSNTQIDAVNWASKPRQFIDGEDICAGNFVQLGNGRTMFFGWIPQAYNGSAFGGHFSLPREIYALPDGSLATKIDPTFGSTIKGGQLFPYTGSAITAQSDTWSTGTNSAQHTGNGYGRARLSTTPNRFNLEFDLSMSAAATRGGALLAANQLGPYGIELTVEKSSNDLRIRYDSTGSGGWNQYSIISVRPGDLDGTNHVRIIAENNMIELFVNDRYSLAARIPVTLNAPKVDLLAVSGTATFTNVTVYAI